MTIRVRHGAAAAAVALLVTACVAPPASESVPTTAPVASTRPAPAPVALAAHTTGGDGSGNRWVRGAGSVPATSPVAVDLDGPALWVVGAPSDRGTVWVVAGTDGRVWAFTETDGILAPTKLNRTALPPGTPPVLVSSETGLLLLAPPSPAGSPLTAPMPLATGGLAFVEDDGAVVVADVAGNRRFEAAAMADGRLAIDDRARMAVLTGATDRYPHGVLGDDVEASGVTVYDLSTVQEAWRWEVPGDGVVEGVSPMWADVAEDAVAELIVTVSDAATGARLVVLGGAGRVVAESDPIGRGSRWRHVVAVAPFGPDGETEIVDVRTPHIGGIAEFFRVEEGRLVEVASVSGVSSHRIGSRNLDQALAADADGDGRPELVVPDQGMEALVGVAHSSGGAEVVWTVPLGGVLTSNLSGVTRADGSFTMSAGVGERLLVWP